MTVSVIRGERLSPLVMASPSFVPFASLQWRTIGADSGRFATPIVYVMSTPPALDPLSGFTPVGASHSPWVLGCQAIERTTRLGRRLRSRLVSTIHPTLLMPDPWNGSIVL